jgi:class 3 adenylate cyclase
MKRPAVRLLAEGNVVIAGEHVVDTSANFLETRSQRRLVALRVAIPVSGVLLLIAAMIAISLYTDRTNRAGVLTLSNDLLIALESRIALAVAAYLDPAARAVRIARDVVEGEVTGDAPAAILAAGLLREIPQIAIFSIADQDGNYVLTRRGAEGGIDTKIIRNQQGSRRVTWIRRNSAGEEIDRRDDPTDDFDPRTRPWYVGAATSDALFWTSVYVFFTDRTPGVTVSIRRKAEDGRLYVVGADITLDALSSFLSALQVGANGRAIIVDDNGRLIAAPANFEILRTGDGAFATKRVDEMGSPVLTGAYDRYRVEGYGRRLITVEDRKFITAVAPLQSAGRDWSLMMVAPESDFVGFVAANNRTALALSLIIVAVAAVLALLLVQQGLRADRSARLLRDRQHAITRQSEAFSVLAAQADLFDPSRGEPPAALTESLADVTDARRASIWRVTNGGRPLYCEDSFDRETRGHVDGLELHRDELPQFFTRLLDGEEVVVADAAQDRRTSELHRVLMNPLGTQGLLAVPVRRQQDVIGAVWLENPSGTAAARDFVRAVAHMLALRMTKTPDPAPTDRQIRAVPVSVATGGPRSFSADLARVGVDQADIDAHVYDQASVMVLHISDAVTMARRLPTAPRSFTDDIVCALQEIAAAHQVPYLKIVGHDVVAAAGLDAADPEGAAQRIADTALKLRDRCAGLCDACSLPQEFRIGIDCGVAIGSTVGNGPQIFNLWGEAVRTAGTMAATALPGTVQVTEAAYDRLRHDYLFRPRGAFYVPRVGEARTLVLAGRL